MAPMNLKYLLCLMILSIRAYGEPEPDPPPFLYPLYTQTMAQALHSTESILDERVKIAVYVRLARVQFHKGDIDEAVVTLSLALAAADAIPENDNSFRRHYKARILAQSGRYQRVLDRKV